MEGETLRVSFTSWFFQVLKTMLALLFFIWIQFIYLLFEEQGKVQELNQQLIEARKPVPAQEGDIFGRANLRHVKRLDDINSQQKSQVESEVTRRLEEELSKRDELIEVQTSSKERNFQYFHNIHWKNQIKFLFSFLIQRLHEENEKLFERLTDRSASTGSPQVFLWMFL
mgnify:CR=1 FL=1